MKKVENWDGRLMVLVSMPAGSTRSQTVKKLNKLIDRINLDYQGKIFLSWQSMEQQPETD